MGFTYKIWGVHRLQGVGEQIRGSENLIMVANRSCFDLDLACQVFFKFSHWQKRLSKKQQRSSIIENFNRQAILYVKKLVNKNYSTFHKGAS